MYSIICAAGLLGNVLVIVVFVFYEKKKTLTEAFFLNLAVADILFLCTLPFLVCQLRFKNWIFGDIMCKMVFGMYKVNLFTSMLTLTAITLDRFVSIVRGVKAHKYQQHKHKWGTVMCAFIWVTSVLLAVPQFIFSNDSRGYCSDVYDDKEKLEITVYSFQLIVGFFLPLLNMVVCYSFILNTLIRSKSLQKKKSIRIILTLVVAFIVTQMPFNVTFLISILHKHSNHITDIAEVLSILEAVAYLHACLNPILYFFVGTKFRNNFWKMLRCFKLVKEREEPSRGNEGSSKVASGSTHMEVFSLVQTNAPHIQ
ncbi:unnamed protein product [Staurois parvus]|uniref:G-protein coupled receptors family 1 profile domain-containing protein n=1 Tax=Staurois parvus TaxID=386267 RepID=A0ABN9HMV1_9NEOB|nr:unnamed protein product [Staurois parvus]